VLEVDGNIEMPPIILLPLPAVPNNVCTLNRPLLKIQGTDMKLLAVKLKRLTGAASTLSELPIRVGTF